MDKKEILNLLLNEPWENLRARADEVRKSHKGSHVFVRGLVEFSNICRRNCAYCGLRYPNTGIPRYRLAQDVIFSAAKDAVSLGADTIVLQSGEGACDASWLAEIIKEITVALKAAVTISVGERCARDYELWKEAGASRYLLRHETSSQALYAKLHPGYALRNRVRCLQILKSLGYETGGGFMVGVPGQTMEMLADDIKLCMDLEVDMAGIGPFIPQANTPLAEFPNGSVELCLRALAVLRLCLPEANLPATTALATLDPEDGQRRGLEAGANVLMPSFTPVEASRNYSIYDRKKKVSMATAKQDIEAAGRTHALAAEK